MKDLPKVSKKTLLELDCKNKIKPIVMGLIATTVAGASFPAMASSDRTLADSKIEAGSEAKQPYPNTGAAVILSKPSMYGEVFAAHYSHSSHASHASHYSCTPGRTC